MSESPPATSVASASGTSPLLVVVGILFILIWGIAITMLIAMTLMGTLMANDAGKASSDKHAILILGVLVSQIALGIAGIPGGLAFFWRTKRRLLLWLFAGLFIVGVLGHIGAWMFFMPGAA